MFQRCDKRYSVNATRPKVSRSGEWVDFMKKKIFISRQGKKLYNISERVRDKSEDI